jgi:hypothetical protein
MEKIASPQELASEIQRLVDYCQGPEPSREVLATELQKLATRVGADADFDLGALKECAEQLDKASNSLQIVTQTDDPKPLQLNRLKGIWDNIEKIVRKGRKASPKGYVR